MAKILYALCGEGGGHTSRTLAVSAGLRARGHSVRYIAGGSAKGRLERLGERVLEVPAFGLAVEGGRIRLLKTIRNNLKNVLVTPFINKLADTLLDEAPDLLINDFEPCSAWAADLVGVPVLSLNHQQVISETCYPLPLRYRFDARLLKSVLNLFVPPRAQHTLITSLTRATLKRPHNTTLVAPIIRPEVAALTPQRGEHLLVYHTQGQEAEGLLEALSSLPTPVIAYNFHPQRPYPNIVFKAPSLDGFLEDLRTCRAVIATAGFTLMSEALSLGKPLLVTPLRGLFSFEQTLNAFMLERSGFGKSVIGRSLTGADVRAFVGELEHLTPPQPLAVGNEAALECIERVLRGISPQPLPQGRLRATVETF